MSSSAIPASRGVEIPTERSRDATVTAPRIATLDSLLAQGDSRRSLVPLSLTLHAVGITALVVGPLLQTPELPEPAGGVRAFFAAPVEVAPPPPPPPPAPARVARVAPRPAAAQPAAFTAPVEIPEVVQPEDGLDLGFEGGIAGGVEGGVPGGVVGGVVGGLPEAPAPPKPVRVGGRIPEPRKLKHVAPVYPDLAKTSRLSGVVIIEATLRPDGQVDEARVLRGPPVLDRAALEAVRQWVYAPTLLEGVPVPVVLTVTVTFNLITR